MAAEGGRQMKRLTSNKNTSDMSMIELAHNSCYIDNKRNARYRDYNLDIDSRQLARSLMKDICNVDLTDLSDEEFEEYMGSMLSVEIDSTVGLLALFYRNLWAIADLREKLKEYEDLEEQGRLVILPCKIGDTIYEVSYENREFVIKEHIVKEFIYRTYRFPRIEIYCENENGFLVCNNIGKLDECLFLTQAAAEAKLKELRGKNE